MHISEDTEMTEEITLCLPFALINNLKILSGVDGETPSNYVERVLDAFIREQLEEGKVPEILEFLGFKIPDNCII